MNLKRPLTLLVLIPLVVCLCAATLVGAGAAYTFLLRPQPASTSQQLFDGITYERESLRSPRPMVVHWVTVDLRAPGVSLLVTPGDPDSERSLEARTTSEFLEDFDVQIAVNGDGFEPWYSNTILDYYPHSGDPVDPVGFAASQGTVYAQGSGAEPTLYISKANKARFTSPIGKVYNAVSGNLALVAGGQTLPESLRVTGADIPQPRTAVALDKSSRRMIILVVDGRQPGYSEGATLEELAGMLIAHGAQFAMNLDGGGSTTLVVEGRNGGARLLNSPIDHVFPGRERPVGNHLGIRANRVGAE